jgi:hypothetical protein
MTVFGGFYIFCFFNGGLYLGGGLSPVSLKSASFLASSLEIFAGLYTS